VDLGAGTRQRVAFSGGGGHTLAGRLDLPREGDPWAYAVLAHCFTCTKDLKGLYYLGGALAGAGLATLRLDFAGLGESGGIFADTDLAANVEDLVGAARFLEREHQSPRVLVGHSLGGTACLLAAREIPSVRAVALIATAADPARLGQLLAPAPPTGGVDTVRVEVAGREYDLGKGFFQELAEADVEGAVRGLGLPLLVVHSADDDVVPVADGESLFGWASHPKSFVSLRGMDHLLSRPEDAVAVGRIVAAWARAHVT
jgi:fermentation-respiration switch protein FrsA (DUF1100 family)